MPRRVSRPAEVTEAKPEEAAVPDAEVAPEASEVTADTAEENSDASAVTTEPAPTSAGTVEVRVLQVAFPFQDEDGIYHVLRQGETGKVTAAQADRGEALGAVERV